MAAQGRDIKLATSRVEGYRNFATKLWNACRFAEMNGCATLAGFMPQEAAETLNRWIAHEAARTAGEVTEAIEAYRFNDAANAVYRFVWNVYCDWYLELAKPVLLGPDSAAKTETQAMVAFVRDHILVLLHPFMPFITEELWAVTAEGGVARGDLLTLSPWPLLLDLEDRDAEAEIGWVVDLITAIRSVRTEMNIAPALQIPLVLAGVAAETDARAQRWGDVIRRMARIADIAAAATPPAGAVQVLVRGDIVALPLKGVIDLAAERARLEKEKAKAEADINRIDAKLANPKFVAHADPEVVEADREKREEAAVRRAKILEALERLRQVE
jgi:valyl-tRNA synthetase